MSITLLGTLQNGGRRNSGRTIYSHSFNGTNCEVNIDDCPNHRCQNGATCMDGVNTYPPLSFPGQFCTDDVDECRLQPSTCQNGGTCSNTRNYGTPNGGPDCSENIDDCADAPCITGSTCIDRVASFCPPEWTGMKTALYTMCVCVCVFASSYTNSITNNFWNLLFLMIQINHFKFCTDDVDECRLQPNTCQNGGTCSNTRNGYNCVCVNGWSGPDCSENIDDCAAEPCTPGSTCIDRVASFVCSCPPSKTGQ
uniref:Si:ch73-281k2.5 n=1 Tax=Sinocyclocheilus anshuiensis TaxID=1608454 RepID=A0A671KRM1_9TELE